MQLVLLVVAAREEDQSSRVDSPLSSESTENTNKVLRLKWSSKQQG